MSRFCSLLETEPLAPISEDFILQLASFKLRTTEAEKVKATLFNDYRIEVPVMRQGNNVYLRYSINAFNTQEDLDRLYEALRVIIKSF